MSGIIENLGNAVSSMFRGRTPQAQPSATKVHIIPWGLEAFPEDGSGRSLHIKAGDTLHFVPIDDEPHNVAEADIVGEDEWLPAQDRQLGINYRTRPGFNEQLKINKAGTYYLVSPVNGQHKVMRLTVVANGVSPQREQLSQQEKARLDQAKQRAQQAVNEARQCADEARQAMAQAQQQQTEANGAAAPSTGGSAEASSAPGASSRFVTYVFCSGSSVLFARVFPAHSAFPFVSRLLVYIAQRQ